MSLDDPFMDENARQQMLVSNCIPQYWQPEWERADANTDTLPEWDQLTDAYQRYIYGDAVDVAPTACQSGWNARSRDEKKRYFLKPRTMYVGDCLPENPYMVTQGAPGA